MASDCIKPLLPWLARRRGHPNLEGTVAAMRLAVPDQRCVPDFLVSHCQLSALGSGPLVPILSVFILLLLLQPFLLVCQQDVENFVGETRDNVTD